MKPSQRIEIPLRGMDERPSAPLGSADLITNLTCDANGIWRNIRSVDSIGLTTPPGSGDFVSLHWWAQRGPARQWLLWERSTSGTEAALEVMDGPARAYQPLQTGRTYRRAPNTGTTYLAWGEWLYIVNGVDGPVRWNGKWPDYGSDLVPPGFNTPPPRLLARTLNTQQGASTTWIGYVPGTFGMSSTDWRYGYAMTWLNDLGCESEPSDIVFLENGTEGRSVLLRWPAAPSNVRAVRLWRTINLAGVTATAGERASLYLLQEFPSGSEGTWVDGLADTDLLFELLTDELGPWPRLANLLASYAGRMFAAGDPSYPSRLFYSAAGLPEQWPRQNFFDLGDASGGPITGMHCTRAALIVFRKRGVYIVREDGQGGVQSQALDTSVGCSAGRAIIEAPGRGLVFIDDRGPMLLVGALENGSDPTSIEPLHEPIFRTWQEVDRSSLPNARAVLNAEDNEILFFLPAGSRQVALAYHYIQGFWSRRSDGSTVLSVASANDFDQNVFLGYPAATQPYALSYRGSGFDDRIVWTYRTSWLSFADRVKPDKLVVYGHLRSTRPSTSTASIDILFRWGRDHETLENYAVATGGPSLDAWDEGRAPSLDVEHEKLVWDTAVWGEPWQAEADFPYPVSIAGAAARDFCFEVSGQGLYADLVSLSRAALEFNGVLPMLLDQVGGAPDPR